ncbi:hypothetical protein BDY19DRAFT_894022 [Irpex rosettiformis]|uniref:Uncharacterized protein n=1 Tax=Irpex rosettiformis TaxID=378272 RepID=A0ACB8TYI8_9APHY|nr:hypothetical protein BDY19DRAFT_894022 [Irpex rosettiformis]
MPPKSRRDWSQPPKRVNEPGKRRMELIPSVSRSSGLDKDGDALRNHKVQEEYRDFIHTKLNSYWERFPYGGTAQDTKQRDEVQGNILILFRKLREGLLSAKRTDSFALEVYETSLYLSIIFNSPVQTTSIIPHLLPAMYQALPNSTPVITILLSSLHFLASGYPSQSRYFDHLHSLPTFFFLESHPAASWLRDLSWTLRSHTYSNLEKLTTREACAHILEIPEHTKGNDGELPPQKYSYPVNLVLEALCTLVDTLREKARETNWLVLRTAYREVSLPKPCDTDPAPTRDWLCRSLTLCSVSRVSSPKTVDDVALLDTWIESRRAQGDVRPKEGVEGRWIVVKPKLS